jgi:hypothetical protein
LCIRSDLFHCRDGCTIAVDAQGKLVGFKGLKQTAKREETGKEESTSPFELVSGRARQDERHFHADLAGEHRKH